jgi:phenylalanyl-tRNA synthetase beta chain
MKFSYNWLKEYLPELPRPEKLAEILTFHSFEVEEVKKVGKDWLLDIDILPNRAPDCLSHIGLARECAALMRMKMRILSKLYANKLKEDKNLKIKDFIKVKVKDKNLCPRYCAKVIVDVKVGPSPKWLKERLEICGINSINNVVDATNYVMLELGQPLHAFDLDKIGNFQQIQNSKLKTIVVRKAKRGEKIVTLDNEKYDLDDNILVIADQKEPIAIAGIKGAKKAEIDKKTKNIVLEAANFDRLTIYRASKKLNLETESAKRFKYGLDPNLAFKAIERVAQLIREICGGKIVKGTIDFYPQKVLPKRIRLNLDYLKSLLGIEISEKEIKNILKKLNFKITSIQQSYRPVYRTKLKTRILEVEIPTFRLDISIPEDLIEEVGRIYGFEKISAIFPEVCLIPPKRNLEIFWQEMIKDILKEAGFCEVYNYSFIGEKEYNIFFANETRITPNNNRISNSLFEINSISFDKNSRDIIELENPISKEYQYLRPSLIPNLLKNVQKNQKEFKEIKIFEIGKIFKKVQSSKFKVQSDSLKLKIEEKRMLTGAITGDAFFQAKGIVDSLLNKLGISNIWYDEYQPTPEESKLSIWQKRKCAEIKIDGQEIGFLGEISQDVLENLEIKDKVVVFEIDFEKLIKYCSEEHEFRPISKYPAAVRDLAILVPIGTKVVEVLNKINMAGGKLVRDVDLFDIYEGEELPEGKKSLAFHIIYQAEDRTLSPKEIEEIHNKIIEALEKEIEWQVRK